MSAHTRPPYATGDAYWIENDTDRLLDQDTYNKPKYRDIGATFLRAIESKDNGSDDHDECTVALVWCSAHPEATEDTATFLVRAANSHDDLLAALRLLATAAEHRDNTLGDPCRLWECKANLESAAKVARAAIRRAEAQP